MQPQSFFYQCSLGMGSIGCSSTHLLLKLLLIYGSVFVSSSLRLPPSVHVNLPWGNLSLRFHPVSCHAAVCCQARGSYIVPGATLLGAVLVWYMVNRLLEQTLLHKPLPFYSFVFVFPSYSSYSSYSSCPSFLFCSLAGFHLNAHQTPLGPPLCGRQSLTENWPMFHSCSGAYTVKSFLTQYAKKHEPFAIMEEQLAFLFLCVCLDGLKHINKKL